MTFTSSDFDIDLRDHLHVEGDHDVCGDWLEALRYPEWLRNAMTSISVPTLIVCVRTIGV